MKSCVPASRLSTGSQSRASRRTSLSLFRWWSCLRPMKPLVCPRPAGWQRRKPRARSISPRVDCCAHCCSNSKPTTTCFSSRCATSRLTDGRPALSCVNFRPSMARLSRTVSRLLRHCPFSMSTTPHGSARRSKGRRSPARWHGGVKRSSICRRWSCRPIAFAPRYRALGAHATLVPYRRRFRAECASSVDARVRPCSPFFWRLSTCCWRDIPGPPTSSWGLRSPGETAPSWKVSLACSSTRSRCGPKSAPTKGSSSSFVGSSKACSMQSPTRTFRLRCSSMSSVLNARSVIRH